MRESVSSLDVFNVQECSKTKVRIEIRMLIDLYQTQSVKKQVFFNRLLALIATLLLATTAAAAIDLAHDGSGHHLNNSIIPALPQFDSAAPMRRPANLSSKPEKPMCRKEYGFNLKIESCVDAWRSIPANTRQHTYGRRNRGKFEVPLPQRFLSGQAGGLNVIIRGYRPNIRCLGRFPTPFPGTCSTLLDYIPISNHYVPFVEEPVQTAHVLVPRTGLVIKDKNVDLCTETINLLEGNGDTSSWLDIWRSAVAVEKLCVRHGRTGVAFGQGACSFST
ncbi:MAG: hypothetical protein Q9195_009440 [Heterodermia aff. obscurata]